LSGRLKSEAFAFRESRVSRYATPRGILPCPKVPALPCWLSGPVVQHDNIVTHLPLHVRATQLLPEPGIMLRMGGDHVRPMARNDPPG
jgi:hypothetical protein